MCGRQLLMVPFFKRTFIYKINRKQFQRKKKKHDSLLTVTVPTFKISQKILGMLKVSETQWYN